MKLRNSLLCLLALVLLASCNKPEDDYLNTKSGANLLNLQQTDTFSIDMVSEHWPKLAQTSNLTADVLGTFVDPVFGRTTAGVYTQVRIGTTTAPSWNASSTLDSLVLVLKLSDASVQLNANSIIGANNFKGQTWHLFKLANTMTVGTTYPSDTVLTTSMEIGNAAVSFNNADSLLRMTIKGSMVNKIFRDSLFDSTGNAALFTDATYFDQLMHGIYIMPDSVLAGNAGAGEMAAFNLSDSNSRLNVYYDGGKDWYMLMNYPAERVNVYTHNYTGTEAGMHFGLVPTHADRVYLQALGGVKCVVTIPYLADLVKNNMVAINQAEFIFPKVDSSADPYNQNNPLKILFRPRRSDGNDSIYDFYDDVLDLYAQTYQPASGSYKYLMTRYIQRMLYNYRYKPQLKSLGINLAIPPDNPNAPSRVMLYTQYAANKQNRPKLVLTYTKISDKK